MSEILSSNQGGQPESSGVRFLPVPNVNSGPCAIIATGPSFRGVRYALIQDHVHIIAVKGAIQGLNRVDSWITVDANSRCRREQMAEHRRKRGTQYFAAVPKDFGRSDALKHAHRVKPEADIWWLERMQDIKGLAEDPAQLQTGNSAFAALGLAYHMGFTKIGLFGVDGNNAQYGYGMGAPRGDLSHLGALFQTAIPQLEARGIKVMNAGRLSTWPQTRYMDVITWLNAA